MTRATGLIATDRPAAVIVGLDCITGLQSTRLLTARGIPVVGVVADRRHFSARTRLATSIVTAPLRGEPLVDALVSWPPASSSRPCSSLARTPPCWPSRPVAIAWPTAYRFVLARPRRRRAADGQGVVRRARPRPGLPIPPTPSCAPVGRRGAPRAGPTRACSSLDTRTLPGRRRPGQGILVDRPRPSCWPPMTRYATTADALIAQKWIEGAETDLVSVNSYFDHDGLRPGDVRRQEDPAMAARDRHELSR